MLLFAESDGASRALLDVATAARAGGAAIEVRPRAYRGRWAIGAVGDEDALDASIDPSIDRGALADAMRAAGVPRSLAAPFADAIAHREDVLDASVVTRTAAPVHSDHARPPTLFEIGALADVIGVDLAALLPPDRVEIDRAWLREGTLNHCELGADGVARIRLLGSNGTTLAGRTHALVHELGHALIGVARLGGRSYRAAYGQPDYARFLAPHRADVVCDEEALVRAIADAWLLRRRGVAWSRTWRGAVDDCARDLAADELAAFARFRLAQGLE